ncbi:MAG: hypothetical protein B7X42_04035 [Thiomonas sp. 14-66-4]|nr:MAG: hypothetical protein B7X42_04035 [Thiomonas sp. 14-66-4]
MAAPGTPKAWWMPSFSRMQTAASTAVILGMECLLGCHAGCMAQSHAKGGAVSGNFMSDATQDKQD